MTDWALIERVLDDYTTAHTCAFCGAPIPNGDMERWSLAVRALTGQTSVVWVHAECFRTRLHAQLRRGFDGPTPGLQAPASGDN
jgi:hypothetical protein